MNGSGLQNPEGVISGSFKFKPEIDAAINEFRDLNVIIRAPEIGWLYAPVTGLIVVTNEESFQPLPNERHMMAGDVEAEFLDQLDKSDFVYVMNPEGYLGDMSIFEIGYAHGIRKQMYASNPLNFDALGIRDPKMINLLRTSVAVMSPAAAAQDIHLRLATGRGSSPAINPSVAERNRFDQVSSLKSSPSTALGYIAEGALMRHDNKLLLVEDGRWEHERLTIPGTRVRTGERRATALERLMEDKMGVEIASIAHFVTSFMLPESGYNMPVDSDIFVFDDHIVDLRSEQVKPRRGILPVWVSNVEAEALIDSGQVEPNAAKLITSYLRTAA
jgi:hypothetical protein